MQKKNYTKLIFYIILLVSIFITSLKIIKLNAILLQIPQHNEAFSAYNLWQKQMGYFNIIAYALLLIVAFIEFYNKQQKNLIFIANIFYIALALYIYVSINRNYYQTISTNYQQQNGYWVTLFMGTFYIVGGILISAIGFITVRNNIKRQIHKNN